MSYIPTEQEIEAALARTTPCDPTIEAVAVFVGGMCDLAVREASGFYTASTLDELRSRQIAIFVLMMEHAEVTAQQTEG